MGLVKFAGKCLLLAVLVHVGFNLLKKPSLQKETTERLASLWKLGSVHIPQLAQHTNMLLKHRENIVKLLTYMLLASPILLLQRCLAFVQVFAWALWCGLFFNPYLPLGENSGSPVSNLEALKGLAILGGIMYLWCDKRPERIKSKK